MWAGLASDAVAHLEIAFSALALAALAGIPLGVVAAEYPPVRNAALALAGLGRTVPSLAVLMLLLPVLGVGRLPAVIALALLAVPPIVISVDLGVRGVAQSALQAAAGMGMTATQRFARVTVPLALPVSFSGIRTAATETIASATLATFIGAGGLGDDIVRGLQTNVTTLLFAGALAVAILALGVELLLGAFARVMEARS